MKLIIKAITTIILVTAVISCNKEILLTKKEIGAVQEVLNFYGGVCHRYKGFQTKNGNTKTHFELEMSKSTLLENNSDLLKSHSANIEYLFYTGLQDEKSNYDQVNVKINLEDGRRSEYQYSEKELIEIGNLKTEIDQASLRLKEKEYVVVADMFVESIPIGPIDIQKLFDNLENKYGTIEQTQFQGFEFADSKNFGKITKIRMVQVRPEGALPMTFIFQRKSDKLISIDFG